MDSEKPTCRSVAIAASTAALLVLAALAAGCRAPATTGDTARQKPASIAETTPATAPATPAAGEVTVTPPAAQTVLKIYLDLDEKVQPVERRVPQTKAVMAAAMTALLAGPTAAERKAGLDTLIPKGTRLLSAKVSSGVATVDLTGTFDDGGGSLSMTNRLAQVVYTLTQFPGVTGVRVKLDGKAVTVFGGEGLDLSSPQKRSDYEYSTPAILVDAPARGATVTSPLHLTGTANVFEAVFQLEVLGPDGTVKAFRTVTASSGTGTRGTWSATVPFSLGEPGVGGVRVFTLSAKDGTTRENVVDVPLNMTH